MSCRANEEELELSRKSILRAETQAEKSSLSGFDLFEGLPASQLLKVEQNTRVQEFAEGDILFELGGTGQELYLLEAGRVQTYRMMGDKKLVIADLEALAVLGEMGCIGQCVYHCAARATERSIIRLVPRKDLETLMDQFPQVTRRLLDLVGRRYALKPFAQMQYRIAFAREQCVHAHASCGGQLLEAAAF